MATRGTSGGPRACSIAWSPAPGGRGCSEQPTTPQARRKRGRPRDPEAAGRILAAASSLILRRGFDNITVHEVASSAGVGKATVYRRWARNEDLAVAAMERLYRDEMPTADTASIRGDLREMYASVLIFINFAAGSDYIRTTINEAMRDPRVATLYREANARAELSAAVVFDRAIARGEVRADMSMAAALQLMSGLIASRAITGQPMPGIHELDGLVDFVITGIQASAERTAFRPRAGVRVSSSLSRGLDSAVGVGRRRMGGSADDRRR